MPFSSFIQQQDFFLDKLQNEHHSQGLTYMLTLILDDEIRRSGDIYLQDPYFLQSLFLSK